MLKQGPHGVGKWSTCQGNVSVAPGREDRQLKVCARWLCSCQPTGQLTQEEAMGNTGQAGREQSQRKNNALLTHPSSTPLGRKALLNLQITHLPESLNSPSQTSLHKQGLGVPPAQSAISKGYRMGHKG